MWFLNKTTGIKWNVVDKELINRLSKDDNYEEVKEVKKAKEVEKKEEPKKTTKKK